MKQVITDKELVNEIEHLIILRYRPTFLHVTHPDEDGDIQVVVSSILFNDMSVYERIASVFQLIYKHLGGIIADRLVIVQAFNTKEMENVIENVFSEDSDSK